LRYVGVRGEASGATITPGFMHPGQTARLSSPLPGPGSPLRGLAVR
jgi:hypothetical protein